jgi:hypothetical protein
MSTSTFEMELEHVKQIGCPSCQAEGTSWLVVIYKDGLPVIAYCDACEFPIYKDGDWAPELYAIGI